VKQPHLRQSLWQVALLSIAVIATALSLLVLMIPVRKSVVSLQYEATATSAAPTSLPLPALSVKGTHIVASNGRAVTLMGVTRSSLEFDCSGDGHYQQADFQAIRAWGANVVRITLSSEFWASPNQSCPTYHTTVMTAVSNAQSVGLYVILTLQWNAPFNRAADETRGGGQCPLPDNGKDLTMWRDLGAIYRHNSGVLFELLSEPHTPSQAIWYNGGTVTSDCLNAYPQPLTYTGLGMLDFARLVRGFAPQTILIISGNENGYDLSGVGQEYLFPLQNILFGTHPFDHQTIQQPGDWARAFGTLARTMPVIATEFGAYNCQTTYIAQEIAYFRRLHMSWVAWGWEPLPCSTPALIRDWQGTPTAPYGTYIRQQMLANQSS
jgi:hypothetical protein